MRMFGLTSWVGSRDCGRVVHDDVEKMVNSTHPVLDILPGAFPKRKRESSVESSIATSASMALHDPKRCKSNTLGEEIPKLELNLEEMRDISVNEKASGSIAMNRIQETIETQLGVEILLKHKELRLIHQELGKCQAALEQLRRCHLVPYPAFQGTAESMSSVMNGTGSAVSAKGNVPQWAPPNGVTDGPYTRHYSKWLIPDPRFDGEQVEWYTSSDVSRAGKTVPEGRSTRNSIADGNMPAGKSRSQRGSAGQKLHALSSGYPQAKEKVGPSILKRADGQTVKLVCIDCQRENFSSTQGFINHCRIAHRRDFKSHEEAAIACGQPIEVDETGGILGEEKSPMVANGLVHPLVQSAPANRETYLALLTRIESAMSSYRLNNVVGVTSSSTSSTTDAPKSEHPLGPSETFVSSLDTPHLSNLMRSKGFGGNLTEFVDDAKGPFDDENFSSHDEESDGEGLEQRKGDSSASDISTTAMRVPARAAVPTSSFNRPGSSKGVDGRKPGVSGISPRLSRATPVLNTTPAACLPRSSSQHVNTQLFHQTDHSAHRESSIDVDMMHGPSLNDLSPNTISSNNAPSLVSDDGEYEDGDDVESVSNDDEDSVAEIDIEDGVEKVLPSTGLGKRRGINGDVRLKKEDKHVTFVPMKENDSDRRK